MLLRQPCRRRRTQHVGQHLGQQQPQHSQQLHSQVERRLLLLARTNRRARRSTGQTNQSPLAAQGLATAPFSHFCGSCARGSGSSGIPGASSCRSQHSCKPQRGQRAAESGPGARLDAPQRNVLHGPRDATLGARLRRASCQPACSPHAGGRVAIRTLSPMARAATPRA